MTDKRTGFTHSCGSLLQYQSFFILPNQKKRGCFDLSTASCKNRFARSWTRFTSFWRRVLLSFPSEVAATSEKLIPMPKFAGSRSQGNSKQDGNPLSVDTSKTPLHVYSFATPSMGLASITFPTTSPTHVFVHRSMVSATTKTWDTSKRWRPFARKRRKQSAEIRQKQWTVTLFLGKPLTKTGQKLKNYGSRTREEPAGAAHGFRSGLTEWRQQ